MIRIWGKVVGTMLGFALGGGPFGAMLGMAAGHAYDQRAMRFDENWVNPKTRPTAFGSNTQQAIFTNGVIVLGAKMAKADGQVTRAKIEAFKRAFHIRPEDEARVGRLFDNARRSTDGFEPYAFSLAQTFVSYPVVLEEILSGLFLIAAADDNTVSIAEADFLRNVAFTFNFTPEDFQRIAARTGVRLPSPEETREARRETRRDSAHDPYLILGISEKASNDDIKTAYRTLIRKHHPDKLIAQGLPQEFIATANEKMKRINVAYDSVCRIRGIK
jgi:DnaJ like chaperone protein